MGLTAAMYTGLSGLNANQSRIETIGHNIANINTTAFKGSRTVFQTQFSETMSMGTAPSDVGGGTNPMQIGHGVMVGSTQRTFVGGSVETTGLPSDLAIEGAGYFIVQSPAGQVAYTRDGAFAVNSANQLVSVDGYRVQGFAVDENFTIVPGTTQPINIPIGALSIARPTDTVVMDGDLSAAEDLATQGTTHASQALVTGGGGAAAATTGLTDLRSASSPNDVLFAEGDVFRLSGATRGERTLPEQQFIVGTTGSTLGDLASWMQSALGIQAGEGLPGSPGVVIENGALVIRGNAGVPNAPDIESGDLTSSNAASALPLTITQTAEAAGGGVFTSYTVYDSLGNAVPDNVTFTLEGRPDTGPVWRYYVESAEEGTGLRGLGSGIVAFNNEGRFLSATGNEFSVDRAGSGAASPLTFAIDLTRVNGLSTQVSNVMMADQDGFPPGTLTAYSVGEDGTISGVFSNGLMRPLGQVVLATFTNEAGLVAHTDNLYTVGPNSGSPLITAPGALGAGLVRGGALEMSNVDLSREFIGLITASTGFQANSRVISTSNEMLDQLLLTLR